MMMTAIGPTGPDVTDPRQQSSARAWTTRSFLALVAYLVWFPIVFALGYWVTSWFDVAPGTGETIASQGLVGWLTNLGYAVVVGLPAWAGAWCANTARRLGGGTGAAVALVLNVLVGTALLVLCLVEPL